MANGNYYLNQGIETSGVAEVQNPIYAKEQYNPFKGVRPVSRNVGQYFTSDSLYDAGLGDISAAISEGSTIDDLRAKSQGALDMWGNALVNNLVIAGTTAISGTLGLVDGLIEAAGTGETDRLWNNEINKWAVEQLEAARAAFPIYRGKEYEAKSTWEKLGTGIFWAEAFLNLGFTEGMLIPGMGVARLMGAAPKLAKLLIPSFVSSIGEGSIEAINTKNDEVNSKIAMANARYNELVEGIEDPYQLLLINLDYNDTLQAIEQDAKDAGNLVLAANIALLTATNTIEFGKLFSRGFGTSKRMANELTRKGIRRNTEGMYDNLSMSMEVGKAVGKKLLDATSEMGEEVSQEIIGRVPSGLEGYNRFNESQFNPEKRELATNLMQGFILSASEAMKDSSTYEAAAMGFVTGLFGVPMFKKRAIPITIENSLFSEINEARDKVKRYNQVVDEVNTRLSQDEKINSYYNGLVRHMALLDDMNIALDNDNQFDYKNAESEQIISDTMMFDEIGDLDRLEDIINNSIDTSDEGIAALIEETSKDGEGPFMHNGNPMYAEDVRRIIEERKLELLGKVQGYRKSKEAYSKISPLLSKEALKAAIFHDQQIKDHASRLDNLFDTAYRGVDSVNKSTENSDFELTDKETFRRKVLTDSLYRNDILAVLNNDTSSVPYNERKDIFTAIEDAIKLSASIMLHNQSLKELLNNPSKFEKSLNESNNRAAKINEATDIIKRKEEIVNKSVSEINEALDNGEMTEDDLLGMFPEGLPSNDEVNEATEAETKVKSALDIRNKTNRIKALIDKSDSDDVTKSNAKKLIDTSKSLSENLEELTDLGTEAFNDPSILFDELDPSLLNMEMEDILDELEIRLGGAKSLLSEVMSILDNNDGKLESLPDNIGEALPDSQIESTGHDSVDKSEPVNSPKVVRTLKGNLADSLIQQAIEESNDSPTVKTLRDVIKDIDRLVEAGAIEKTIKNLIYKTASYKKSTEGFPGLVLSIDNYISSKLQERESTLAKTPKPKTVESNYIPQVEEDEITYSTTLEEVVKDSNQNKGVLDSIPGERGIYTSWLSPLSKYYRYSPKGDRTTFDQIAEGMNYTPEKLRRVKAIWNYLDRHNAFDYVNNGGIKVGDKIEFAISLALNEEAGELVIIIMKDGLRVGVLPSENDKEFNSYSGLPAFVELIKKEYESLGSPISFTSKYTTTVNKNMVGRAPYTSKDEMNSLNDIHKEATSAGATRNVPFELGISSGDGRNAEMIISSVRKGTSKSVKDKLRTIMSPLNAKKGQPYLLIRTSDPKRAYLPIPFIMEAYSLSNETSSLGKALESVLSTLSTMKPADIMKVKREIQELLAIPELHINILKNGNLKIDAKFQGESKQTNIYNGKLDNPNLVQAIKSKLYGTPYQVSRKYINDTYKGLDYNRMIGELASTNLDGYHTIDDWFTINPVDLEGNEFKGKTIKSTKVNPNSAKPTFFEYTWKGIPLKVDLNSFDVTDSKGVKRTGKNADIVRALAYGYKLSKSGTYQTPWGWFNSETLEFVDEPKQENIVKRSFSLKEISAEEAAPNTEGTTSSSPTVRSTFATSEELEEQARKKGWLTNTKRKLMWQALNLTQLETLLNTKGLRLNQLIVQLDRAFNLSSKTFDEKKLKGTVNDFIGVKPVFRRVTLSREQMREKELKWLDKALPNLTEEGKISIVDGLIKISEEDGGGFAWGQFKQGVITLSNMAARGTVYHEAFHAVTHTLLNESEYNALFEAGRTKYGNLSEIAIEEKLAEDFRRYMQLEEMPFIGRVVKVFRKLKHIVQNLLGKEPYLNKLYYNINNGVYANRASRISNITRNMTEQYTEEMQSILKNALRDSQGRLLAPNGNISNLTERLYAQVRTKAFKEWFGDWENNPANASKVVDENGEPMVVYHGGQVGINVFLNANENEAYNITNHANYSNDDRVGIYFSKYKFVGESYAKKYNKNDRQVYEVFLNIRNVRNIPFAENFKNKLVKSVTFGLIDRPNVQNVRNSDLSTYYNGFDGLSHENGEEFVVFNSTQIKSATDNVGTFDAENSDIRYSRVELTPSRFQEIVDSVVNNATHTIKGRNDAWGRLIDTWKAEGVEIKGYRGKDNKYRVTSVRDISMQSYYRKVEQYHRDKLSYGRLSNEDKQYLADKGISIKEYNSMSTFEKELLFHCK